MIERVAHTHEHAQNDRKIDELSRIIQSNRSLLTYVNKNKKLTISL